MNQKTLNDIANQEFANMKKIVDQTPKSLEKLFEMMKEPVEILESDVDYSQVVDYTPTVSTEQQQNDFLIDLVLSKEEIDEQLKKGQITIAQAEHFLKISKETLKQQEKQIYGFLAQKMANTAFRNEEVLTMLAHGYNSQYKVQLDNITINRIVKTLLEEKMLPSFVTEQGKIIPYELAKVLAEYNEIKSEQNTAYIYNGRYYQIVKNGFYDEMDALIEDKTRFTKNLRSEVWEHVLNQTRTELPDRTDYINFENGQFNIKTRELEPHTPEIFSLGTFKGSYDPMKSDITGTAFETYLKSSIDESLIPTIQEMIGLCLYPLTDKTRKFFILTGEGSNGKSVLMAIIKMIIPEHLRAEIAIKDYDERFINSALKGKTVNINTDDPSRRLQTVGRFKAVTSGESISVERKQIDVEIINPLLTHISSFNTLPSLSEKSDAFFNRLIVIPFERTFGTLEEVLAGEKDAVKDPTLIDKISNELDIIISWAINGLYRVIDNNYTVSECEKTKAVKEEYRLNADTIEKWVRECIVKHKELPNKQCLNFKTLYRSYCDWCDNESYEPTKRKAFDDRIRVLLKKNTHKINGSTYFKVSYKGFNRNDLNL